jgi:hypothetical protein
MSDNPEHSGLNDLLRGATAIAEHLRSVGLNDVNEDDVYYFARSKKLTIGRFGKDLLASKQRINRDLAKALQQPA